MPRKTAHNKTSRVKFQITNESQQKQKRKSKIEEEEKEKEQKNENDDKKITDNKNIFQCSESIVKSILDKIIINSFRKAYSNSIALQVQDYYFDYLKNQINAMLATKHIFYSDEPEDIIIDNSKFWNTKYDQCNTWIEVSEPKTVKYDRYENVFSNIVSIKNDLSIDNNDISPLNDTDNKNNIFLKKYTKSINNKIEKDLDILEENSSKDWKEEENKNLIKNTSISRNTIIPKIKNVKIKSISINNKNNSSISSLPNNKKKKNEVLEMTNKEIPGIKDEYDYKKYEPSNINDLRREKIEEIIIKEKEHKKLLYKKKTIKINQNIIEEKEIENENENLKIIDSNKLTFDSNGKIILFRPVKLDILTKDFAIPKDAVKTFEQNHKKNYLKKNTRLEEHMEKKIEREKNNLNNSEKIIKNPIDPKEVISRNQYIKLNTKNNIKIPPSGSNFSIMLPNIGVVLKENEQIKKGTREFGKYFKKYTVEDYDRIAKEYIPLQNKTIMINKVGNSIKTAINRSSSLISNNHNNTYTNDKINKNKSVITNNKLELPNPLLIPDKVKDFETNQSNKNYNNTLKTTRMNRNSFNTSILSSSNKNYNLSTNRTNETKRILSKYKYDGVIKLNKEGSSSLKKEIDSLQDLEMRGLNIYYKQNKINIFDRNFRDLFKKIPKIQNISQDLNDFNKNIITNKAWGTKTMRKNMSSENILYNNRQTKYPNIRELGIHLLNGIKVKFPRERKNNLK